MTITADQAASLSAQLLDAEAMGVPIAPIGDAVGTGDVDGAYAIQAASLRHWLANGRQVVGRKIGLTNPAVQRQLGVDQPDFGTLFADMAFDSGDEIPDGHVMQAGVEAEMAFVFASDLESPDITVDDVAAAVESVRPALEIVGSRIADWNIGIVDTVADNASSGAFVLGPTAVPLADVDLTGSSMQLRRMSIGTDEELVSSGTGADCLGSPLIAAHWLATEMIRRGTPVKAGDIILTGALGPMVSVAPGDSFTATIEGLGDVTVRFGR